MFLASLVLILLGTPPPEAKKSIDYLMEERNPPIHLKGEERFRSSSKQYSTRFTNGNELIYPIVVKISLFATL
jgi:hypothetical protein